MSKKRSANPSETEESLRRQLDEITRLAGGLAHEVNNPLSTIRMNMGLLAEDLEKIPESVPVKRALRRVATVQQETKRLERLLKNFLHLTRPQHLELTKADINEEIRNILRFFKPEADEKHIEISECLTPNLPLVRLNSDAFHQAVINLLRNAIQAMKEDGGKLIVQTRDLGEKVAIDVIDNGCGISPKTIERIFDPYYSTKKDGSGLGLPIVNQIIIAHGGGIAISSEVGFGTQFTITLPVPTQIPEMPPPSVVILPKD